MKTAIKVSFFVGMMFLTLGCSESYKRSNNMEARDASSTKSSSDTTMVQSNLELSKITNKSQDKSNEQESISPASGSSSAAVENIKDTLHKFIRTGDLKFKVENVEKTTYKIEDITTNHGGFVTYTNLTSNINNTTKTQVSADSSAETTSFTVTNSIILRVPNTQLDTTLKDVAKLVGFLDYRVIKADDISLQLLANNLLQKRMVQHAQRLAKDIDANHKKLDASVDAEDNLLAKQEAADNATVSNLSMAEQRQYSTVKIELYQPETITTTIVVEPKPMPAYQVSFVTRLWHSLQFGWNMLQEVFLAIASLWVIVLLAIAGYIWYRKYIKIVKAN